MNGARHGALLRWSLIAGVVYFLAMATAHFFSIKIPVLFVYWDTPFYAYQDKIIAFAVIAYASLFWTASRIPAAVPGALVAIWATVAGLAAVNLSDALASLPGPKSMTAYWLQTGAIAGYAVWLTALYWRDRGTRHA